MVTTTVRSGASFRPVRPVLLAFTRFGVHGMEVAILEANPGLAAMDPVLPAGLALRIPVPEVKDRTAFQNIWGKSA